MLISMSLALRGHAFIALKAIFFDSAKGNAKWKCSELEEELLISSSIFCEPSCKANSDFVHLKVTVFRH